MAYSPECASHFQRNLVLGHHSVVGACQQILNEMSESLQDKLTQPQTHDELTRDTSYLMTLK